MKLSDFRLMKKLSFNNGEIVSEDTSSNIKGEIEFFNLDLEKLRAMNTEVISKLDGQETETELIYGVIPYFTNVEVDMDLAGFKEMTKVPSKELIVFMEAIIDVVNNLFETIIKAGEVGAKADQLRKRIDVVPIDKIKEMQGE